MLNVSQGPAGAVPYRDRSERAARVLTETHTVRHRSAWAPFSSSLSYCASMRLLVNSVRFCVENIIVTG